MAWETDRHGRTRYVQKVRINGRVKSISHGSNEAGKRAEQNLLQTRAAKREQRNKARERKNVLATYERTVKQIVEQTMICQGFVNRRGKWQRVSRLNKPLTPAESEHIKRIKRSSVSPSPMTMFPIRSTLINLQNIGMGEGTRGELRSNQGIHDS